MTTTMRQLQLPHTAKHPCQTGLTLAMPLELHHATVGYTEAASPFNRNSDLSAVLCSTLLQDSTLCSCSSTSAAALHDTRPASPGPWLPDNVSGAPSLLLLASDSSRQGEWNKCPIQALAAVRPATTSHMQTWQHTKITPIQVNARACVVRAIRQVAAVRAPKGNTAQHRSTGTNTASVFSIRPQTHKKAARSD